jgi:hypothetical protein
MKTVDLIIKALLRFEIKIQFYFFLSSRLKIIDLDNDSNQSSWWFSFKIIREWWFGTDVPDLYRTILINSKFTKKENYEKHLDNYLSKYIDEMQLVLDRNKKSSEIHMIIKKW